MINNKNISTSNPNKLQCWQQGSLHVTGAHLMLFVLIFSLGNVFMCHKMIIIDEGQEKGHGQGLGRDVSGEQQEQQLTIEGKSYSENRNTMAHSKNAGLLIDESFIASTTTTSATNVKTNAKGSNKNNDQNFNTDIHRNKQDEKESKSKAKSEEAKPDSNSGLGSKSGWNDHNIPEDGIAGCLLLKDDNDRLPEWLAYHWLTLPLKYLLVAIDPTGTTSPHHILDKWGGNGNSSNTDIGMGMGIEIEVWDDVDYDHWMNEELDEKHKHRDRQKLFLADCERHHKKKGRSWLAIIDPDEFITYNLINRDDPKIGDFVDEDVPEQFVEKSYVNSMHSIRKGFGSVENFYNGRGGFGQVDSQSQSQQTIFSFIQENENNEPWINEPCYLMPRLFFSAVESPPSTISQSNLAQYGLDPLRFSTTRFFHHARRGAFDFNHYGKVLVDLRRIMDKEIERDMYSIHRPNYKSCHRPVKPYIDGLLRVHHYLGSWEQYSAKSDVRRSRGRFEKFGSVDYGTDYQLQHWIGRFVEVVGVEKAKYLLDRSGVVEKNSVRLIDKLDFVHVQHRIETRAGEKELLTYVYDEDGSVVDIQNSEGNSIPLSEEDVLNSVI